MRILWLILVLMLLALPAMAENRIEGDPVTIGSGNLDVGDTDTTGTIKWFDNNGEWWAITTADIAANLTFTWPVTDGNADEFLQTNGAGVLTWAEAASYWQRNGIVLSPKTADDTVTIPGTAEDLLLLEYTGGDASGATIEFWHNSASPADNDKVGELIFQGEDSGGGTDDYVEIKAYAEDVTAGTEDGGMSIAVSIDGTMRSIWDCWEDLVVVNDSGQDVDFRVEGENDTHLIFTDAANDRVGISDTTPDALVDINGDGTTADETLTVTRDLTSVFTDSPVVLIHQDNINDNQASLFLVQDGDHDALIAYNTNTASASVAIQGVTDSTAATAVAIHGEAQGVTANMVHGIRGDTASTHNGAYSIVANERIKLGTWADLDQQSAIPADPQANDGRIWLADGTDSTPKAPWQDHKVFMTDEGSNNHDLTCLMKQVWSGTMIAGSDQGGSGHWLDATHSGAAAAAGATSLPWGASYDWTNSQVDEGYGQWAWIAIYDAEYIQSDVVIWQVLRKFGDGYDRAGNSRLIVKARVYLSAAADFNSVKLFASDLSADNASVVLGADFKASANATWYEATLTVAGDDIGAWANDIAVGIEAYGVDLVPLDIKATEIRVRWLSAELWAD